MHSSALRIALLLAMAFAASAAATWTKSWLAGGEPVPPAHIVSGQSGSPGHG